VKVLSIDGGGIRGILPVVLIAEIERRTNRHAYELFDLIVGTSVGGVTALALTRPHPEQPDQPHFSGESLTAFYHEVGPRIFTHTLARQLKTAGSLIHEKYPATELEAILEEHFGSTPLSDAMTEVMVTAFDIEVRMPLMFKSRHANADPGRDLPMRLVGRGAMAAPTFFEPARLEFDGGPVTVVDGGVFANNPAMCAYAEALKTVARKDLFMVSLGTGAPTRALPYKEVRDWGLAHWARPLLDVSFDGVNHAVDHQLENLLRARQYFRFQASFKDQHLRLDDAGVENMAALTEAAEELIVTRSDDIDTVCERLTA
jgi:patatin-like phospholipase/acyl hydrolase